jgi:methanogenic corrinoid protein MtbC1
MVVFVERVPEDTAWRHGDTADLADHLAAAPPDPSGGRANFLSGSGPAGSVPSGAVPSGAVPFGAVPKNRRMALLGRVVATEILPRLAIARLAMGTTAKLNEGGAAEPVQVTTLIDTSELVRLLLVHDARDGVAFIETLLARGLTPEALYTGILPDAARWLGEMWEDDRCDFAQVTIALGRLQQAARVLSPRFQAASVTRADGYGLLLLPAPGEQHTFGLLILAEFFQRAGWRVAGGPKLSGADAAELVEREWFDIVGFSVGSERMFGGLAKTIRQVRRASRNRSLGIMVGGPLFQQRPELAALAGADASAADAQTAVMIARDLVTMRVAAE